MGVEEEKPRGQVERWGGGWEVGWEVGHGDLPWSSPRHAVPNAYAAASEGVLTHLQCLSSTGKTTPSPTYSFLFTAQFASVSTPGSPKDAMQKSRRPIETNEGRAHEAVSGWKGFAVSGRTDARARAPVSSATRSGRT